MFECYYALCVCVVKERPIMFVYSLSIAGPSARPALPAAAASPALRSDPVERRRTLCASRPWSLGSCRIDELPSSMCEGMLLFTFTSGNVTAQFRGHPSVSSTVTAAAP